MEAVRYRPGEAVRWLTAGAETQRKSARARGKAAVAAGPPIGAGAIKDQFLAAAGILLDLGKGAYADLMKRRADANEFILSESEFSVARATGARIYRYDDVEKIVLDRDRATLTLGAAEVVVKPYAYIVAGRAKVPVGWDRNGMEVPFELLVEELAARCRLEVVSG